MIQLSYNYNVFWNHMWQSAQWLVLCTKLTEINLSAFIYRLFHEDFSSFLEQGLKEQLVMRTEEKFS